jgi:hypothetical protein
MPEIKFLFLIYSNLIFLLTILEEISVDDQEISVDDQVSFNDQEMFEIIEIKEMVDTSIPKHDGKYHFIKRSSDQINKIT